MEHTRPHPQRKDSKPPEGQNYEFYPLNGPNPIRLLYLEPDPVTKELRYTMRLADLSSDPPPVYNCLSYTWAYPQWVKLNAEEIDISKAGDRRNPMQCDGKTIYITDNLEAALHRLREVMTSVDKDSKERTPMWIDALCIHQEWREERNEQVAKMDQIYRHAQKVIVWLGPEDENQTATSIDVLERLAAVPRENQDVEIPSGLNHREIYTNLGMDPVRTSEWIALGELLMRTWFNRMWVIQELFEAKEVVVFCGRYELEWKQIVDASELLRATGLGQALMEYLDSMTSQLEEWTYGEDEVEYVTNTVNNQWLFESLREQKKSLKLETLLTYARYFGATNHLDYVYAVRGMWKPELEKHKLLRNTIAPKYNLKVEVIFTAAAYASLVEMGDLNILSLVEDSSLRKTRERKEQIARENEQDEIKRKGMLSKKLPSWVPDWSITPIAETLAMNPRPEKGWERWKASKGLPYSSPPAPVEGKLSVQGIFVTTISNKAAKQLRFLEGFEGVDGIEIFAFLEVLTDLLEHSPLSLASIIEVFWRTIIKDTYRDEPAGAVAQKALTSFLSRQVFEIEKLANASSPELLSADESPLTDIEMLLDKLSAQDPTSTIHSYQTVRQIIEKEKANVTYAGVNEEEKLFSESFRLAHVGRTLFCTKVDESRGLSLGIGPQSLKKDDEVWIIAGADVPMVLRPRGEGEWSLVGECYVHGIMDGEIVRDLREGGKTGNEHLGKAVNIVLM
ncbi:Heterokaryon incompatibility protein 6 OR allele [Lachnellula suecica]|uniref:Heterokaryon incompatibility protein 6 OR allele n=1 Tax=Lachnellula suecica TaxID=602035 RepID=A0A8T9CEU2_9HELO|nr:Heterokaryon incompatibility protein 6 OR allele [Lachnellula suecica]